MLHTHICSQAEDVIFKFSSQSPLAISQKDQTRLELNIRDEIASWRRFGGFPRMGVGRGVLARTEIELNDALLSLPVSQRLRMARVARIYFTCRLYFDTTGLRSPSKPNLRSISRANTLRRPPEILPSFPILFRASCSVLSKHSGFDVIFLV